MDSVSNWKALQQEVLPIGKLEAKSSEIKDKIQQGPYSCLLKKPKLGQMSFKSGRQLWISVLVPSAKEVLKWTVIGTAGGAAIGCVAGAYCSAGLGAGPGAAYGAAAGSSVGFLYGCRQGWVEGKIVIEDSDEYKSWKQNLTQTQYSLFMNTVKQYVDEDGLAVLHPELFDPISLDFITVPVLSPHGHVYDKEYIEMALDRGTRGTDPLGLALYSRQDLIYATDFARRAIQTYQGVLAQIDKGDDSVIETGIRLIYEKYRRDYRAANAQIISDLSVDLVKERASDAQRRSCISQYQRSYEVQL